MSRILIWRKPKPNSDIDVFSKVDYRNLYQNTVQSCGLGSIN